MFVWLSFPTVLNSHIKGADEGGLRLPSCAGNERKKETCQSGNGALREMSCQGRENVTRCQAAFTKTWHGDKGRLLPDPLL